MNIDLAALIPNENEIDTERLQAVQTRLVALLRDQYPDMDVSPNSVFHDNVLRPAAYIIAGSEQAVDCALSDLDLANIVNGDICNCDFVRAYLKTLGTTVRTDIPSVATVRLTYATDEAHEVQNSVRFVFADALVMRPLTALAGGINIMPSTSSNENKTSNIYRLNKNAEGAYFVDLPVYGATDAELDVTGSTGTTDITDEDLVSVSLVSPVVPFTEPETLQDLAARAQQAFPSSALTTRSSARSFFLHKLSNLAGVSAVMPGDTEMTRGGANVFGVQRNAVDIFPKGKSFVRSGQAVVSLSKDGSRWCGALSLPHVPVQIRSITTLDGSALTTQKIVGARKHSAFPGLSAAFSEHEELGLEVAADGGTLDDEITTANLASAYAAEPFSVSGSKGSVGVSGSYSGSVFSSSPAQRLTLKDLDGGTTFELRNNQTGEVVAGITESGTTLSVDVPDAMVVEGAGSTGVDGVYPRDGSLNGRPRYTLDGGTTDQESISFNGSDWEIINDSSVYYQASDTPATPDLVVSWGLAIGNPDPPTVRRATWADIDAAGIDRGTVTTISVNHDVLDLTSGDKPYLLDRWLAGMTVAVANTEQYDEIPFSFEAEQGRVLITYDYDPFLNETAQLLEHETLAGAFDISVLAPRPLILDELKIEYRTELGRWVDTGQALTDLIAYVNESIYPDNLEDSRLSDILLFAGARGVRSITKTGTLYATLATHYSTDRMDAESGGNAYLVGDGTDYDASTALSWVNEPATSVVTLDNTDNDSVVGQRNVQYVLDPEDITLVEHRE